MASQCAEVPYPDGRGVVATVNGGLRVAKRHITHPADGARSDRPCLIDRCATSASLTILGAAALMVPVVAVIDALRG